MTAHWLVYINDDLVKELSNIDLYQYTPLAKRLMGDTFEHIYAGMIPGQVNMQIEEDNFKLQEEIKDNEEKQTIRAIQKRYDDKWIEYSQLIDEKGEL